MSAEAWSALGTILSAIAALAALTVAIVGLSTWRKQLKGTTEYDLARRLMLAVYKLRDAIGNVREPFLAAAEGKDGPADLPWEVVAYGRRWDKVATALTELDVVSLECEVIWGDTVQNLKSIILKDVRILSATLHAYTRFKLDKRFKGELTEKQEGILYGIGEEDEYLKGLQEKVANYEEFVKPHLRRN